MDRITSDLLANGSIMKSQVDRLIAKGLDTNLILRDITISGFMTMDRLIRFIVDKIQNGEYDLSIIDNYDYIKEKDVLLKLAQKQNLLFLDLDSIDMDYRLIEKIFLAQLKNITHYRYLKMI
ncbi:MAG: hypothetical protein PHX65_06100 [Sulfurimonas sp.]|nr:hypothetical protein [Sulfurimonas sp.]